MKSITLSNGQYLPAGVTIETPVHAVGADPELFPDPDKFDPLRFYKLREKARGAGDSGTTNQFVSVNKDYLVFGYGPRVCPGRFFAANEIKIILSKILMKYDVKNADGSLVRYPNIEFTSLVGPSYLSYLDDLIADVGVMSSACQIPPRIYSSKTSCRDTNILFPFSPYSIITALPCKACKPEIFPLFSSSR